jgi:hypothetical protein
MWSHRGKNMWWSPSVLTSSNQDNSAPKLTAVEALSVFKLLEEEGLIYPVQEPGQTRTVYLINEVKEKEWKAFLRESNPFHIYLFRPLKRVFGSAWNATVWFVSVVIAAVVVGLIEKALGI